jgi:hypothetical protein
MPVGLPRLYVDDRGVWREDEAGQPFGIEWGEVIGVGGYKLDGITEVYTVVELNHPSGHFMELHADWSGFADVVSAMTVRLPGIPAGWLAEVERLQPRQAPVTLWRRADPQPAPDRGGK